MLVLNCCNQLVVESLLGYFFVGAGVIYLYMKTIERAHQPAKMWERVKMSKNYETALKQVGTNVLKCGT